MAQGKVLIRWQWEQINQSPKNRRKPGWDQAKATLQDLLRRSHREEFYLKWMELQKI